MDTAPHPHPARRSTRWSRRSTRSRRPSSARTCCSSGCWSRCWPAATCSSRACPGLAKTMAVKTLAQAIGGRVPAHPVHPRPRAGRPRRHPHLQPAGGRVPGLARPGLRQPLLADEINRAPAKVQSALLEVMQERQVTIGRETYQAPDPFLVMATQNPIESEGTYPLPEAQVDRFMLKVLVGYPSPTEEFVVVERMTTTARRRRSGCSTTEQLLAFQTRADAVYVDPAVIEYAVRLAGATRAPAVVGLPDLARYLSFGASPRASINLVLAARALAFLRGPRLRPARRTSRDLALDVLRHRLVLSYEALADEHRRRRRCSQPRCMRTPLPTSPDRRRCAMGRRTSDPRRTRPRPPDRRVPAPASSGGSCAGSTGGSRATTGRCSAATGVDFTDLREYEPGDDLRHIDWNVTARMDTPYVREYIEDREVTAWLLLDRSASMGFGPVDRQKTLVLAEVATTLAQLLARGGNRIGAVAVRRRASSDHPAGPGPQPGAADRPGAPAATAAGPRAGRPPTCRVLLRAASGWPGAARCWSSSPTSSPSPAGSSRWRCWPGATTSSPSRWSTRASPSCPRSGWSTSRTPRPASRSSSTPTTRCSGERLREAARGSGRRS